MELSKYQGEPEHMMEAETWTRDTAAGLRQALDIDPAEGNLRNSCGKGRVWYLEGTMMDDDKPSRQVRNLAGIFIVFIIH